jgi:hypothetical protein
LQEKQLNKLLPLIAFSILLLVPGAQSAFSDTMVIGSGSQVVVETGSIIEIDSDDAPNTLTNKGDLIIEEGGSVVIVKEGNFFNDCDATVSLDGNNAMQIGILGALLSTLTNHGSIFGPGQINFIANTIEVKNSNILTAVLNPIIPILDIVSICLDGESAKTQSLIDTIDAFVESEDLDSRTATSLQWLLNAVLSELEGEDPETAQSKLGAFESRVNLFMNRGIIDQTVGEELLAISQSITFAGSGA